MFDYYRFRHNLLSESAKPNDPPEVVVFVYEDGRCRVQRRSYAEYSAWDSRHYKRKRVCDRVTPYRSDRWYQSVDDVWPLITAMTSNNRYFLVPPNKEVGPTPMTDAHRAWHAAYMKRLDGVPMSMDLENGRLRRIPKPEPVPAKAPF